LGISARTADNHVYKLFRKLDIGSRHELVSLLSEPRGVSSDGEKGPGRV